MDFWRGEAYQAYFQYLEIKGGFYYEVSGSLPILCMALKLLQAMGRRPGP
jgi:alpha 1,2-mannosyltransferase